MKSDNPVFIITMAVAGVMGMLFAVIVYNISSRNKIITLKINKGYQECVIIKPTQNEVFKVWQKECQPVIIKIDNKGETDGN
jgi:hypothetical protein